ncbi:MAG: GNAT family N-acetyltransferase [Anaerolineales bacterium]
MKASPVESVGPGAYGMTTLSCQLEAATQDLDWMLAHFTFVADATTLADDCDIICSPALSVANYQGLASPALSFLGDSPELLANYATFLVEPGSEVLLLVNEEQQPVVAAAFTVVESVPEWQMVFRGEPGELPETEAVPLTRKQLPAMQALAAAAGLAALPDDPFAHGPAYGMWAGHRLVAMSTTRLSIPGAAEVGNIATAPNYRRKGYATHVVAALVKELLEEEQVVFLMVYQANAAAIRLYERLGFVRERPMYLMRCLVEGAAPESTP